MAYLAIQTAGAVCAETDAESATPAASVATLAVVNGDTISTADLDALLIKTHRKIAPEDRTEFDYHKLLKKLVNDRLLVQEAQAIGLDEDGNILRSVQDKLEEDAVRLYVKENFTPPDSVSDAAVREYFDRFYWKIQLRQISVGTVEEILGLIDAIKRGASMDSIAQAVSIDSKRYRGGLHNYNYWADVENELRAAVAGLKEGQISDPFRYRNAYSLVRVEKIGPVDEEAFPAQEQKIRTYLLSEERKGAWLAFLGSLKRQARVETDQTVLDRIVADSEGVFTGGFLRDSDDVVLRIGQTLGVTEGDLRKDVSHRVMRSADVPFDSNLARSLESKTDALVLRWAAESNGHMENGEVLRSYAENLNQALIEAYLNETIVPRIVFDRMEFQEYYDDHLEDFRLEDEVLLDMIVVDTREQADEIESRLASGADFSFLKKQYQDSSQEAPTRPGWASIGVFSSEIAEELATLKIGQSTHPVDVGGRWGIFHLRDRRPGPVQELDAVEMRIRQVMFQRRFNELLDEHLGTLKSRSDIRMFQANIDNYFGTGM